MPAAPDQLRHRDRLRERFRRGGAKALADYELLELLLTFAIPRRDVKPLAKALLARFGSVGAVLDADERALCAVTGIGPRAALLVRLQKELVAAYLAGRAFPEQRLDSMPALVDYARARLGGLAHEALLTVFVSNTGEVRGCEVLQEGSADYAVVYPRQLAAAALDRRANALVLLHLHPSGDCAPSPEDLRLTQALAQALAPLDIGLSDHLIVSPRDCFSFAAHGLLPPLAARAALPRGA